MLYVCHRVRKMCSLTGIRSRDPRNTELSSYTSPLNSEQFGTVTCYPSTCILKCNLEFLRITEQYELNSEPYTVMLNVTMWEKCAGWLQGLETGTLRTPLCGSTYWAIRWLTQYLIISPKKLTWYVLIPKVAK
jgi:hypothetical protein